jgi:hypothetical protein
LDWPALQLQERPMKFTPEQKAHIDALIHGRLVRERRCRDHEVQALAEDNDRLRRDVERLTAENGRLRGELDDFWPRLRPPLARLTTWIRGLRV